MLFLAISSACMNHSQIGLVSVYHKPRGSFDLLDFDLIGQPRQKDSCSGDKRNNSPAQTDLNPHHRNQ